MWAFLRVRSIPVRSAYRIGGNSNSAEQVIRNAFVCMNRQQSLTTRSFRSKLLDCRFKNLYRMTADIR